MLERRAEPAAIIDTRRCSPTPARHPARYCACRSTSRPLSCTRQPQACTLSSPGRSVCSAPQQPQPVAELQRLPDRDRPARMGEQRHAEAQAGDVRRQQQQRLAAGRVVAAGKTLQQREGVGGDDVVAPDELAFRKALRRLPAGLRPHRLRHEAQRRRTRGKNLAMRRSSGQLSRGASRGIGLRRSEGRSGRAVNAADWWGEAAQDTAVMLRAALCAASRSVGRRLCAVILRGEPKTARASG